MDSADSCDPVDEDESVTAIANPRSTIKLISHDVLQITATKVGISVLSSIANVSVSGYNVVCQFSLLV